MRRAIGYILVAAFSFVGTARAADEFPYQAMIRGQAADVRSGPGGNYYPTERLEHGFVVEVYRHDPGGWCAIRPTPESYSWVSLKAIDLQDGGIAVTKKDKLTVYVGSQLSEQRDVHQVRLKEGEPVEVLGTADDWCKIAPPSGEFRWIHKKDLQPLSAQEMADAAPHEEHGNRRHEIAGEDEEIYDTLPHTPGLSNPDTRLRPKTFDEKLTDVDLQLSRMVVADMGNWNLADLKRQADELLDEAKSPLERGKVRLLVNQVHRFEEIQNRQTQIAEARELADRRSTRRRSDDVARIAGDSRFDGTGRLQRVAPRGIDAPQFALFDNEGGLVAYLAPSPGVNLSAYQNMQIGVNGSRNYLTSAQKPLINAQRVTVLANGLPFRR